MNPTIFDGYDPASKTLITKFSKGSCLQDAGWSDSCIVIDTVAPIYSGDFVELTLRFPHGDFAIIKRLECTRDGKWFAWCNDGTFPLGICKAFGVALVQVIDIAKVVLKAPNIHERTHWPTDLQLVADDAVKELYLKATADARHEWETLGHVRGVLLPLEQLLVS